MPIDQDNIRTQMRKGLLEFFVLLRISKGRAYPSDIVQILKKADMIVVEGTIYTLLNRLKREGKLTYDWEESPKGPPRKYFSITPSGLETLDLLTKSWNEMVHTVEIINNQP